MFLQYLEILLREAAKEMLKVRAQPGHLDGCPRCHSPDRKVIEQRQAGAVALEAANINFQPNHLASRQLALQAAPGHGSGLGIQLTRENERARAIGSAGDLPANRRINWRCDSHLLVLIRFHFGLPAAAEGFVERDDREQLIALGAGQIEL